MKRFFSLALIILVVLSMVCVSYAESAINDIWSLQAVVDEFNDPTGEYFVLGGPLTGTFSNSATTNSPLTVFAYCDGTNISIRLLEYNDNIVKNPYDEAQEYQIIIKATIDGHDTKFYMIGFIPAKGQDIDVLDKFYTEGYTLSLACVDFNGTEYYTLCDVLKKCSAIKFAITKKDALDKYVFGIDDNSSFTIALGLLEVANNEGYDAAASNLDEETQYQKALVYEAEGQYQSACEIYSALGDYKDAKDRYDRIETLGICVNLVDGLEVTSPDYGDGTIAWINPNGTAMIEGEMTTLIMVGVNYPNVETQIYGFEKAVESGKLSIK